MRAPVTVIPAVPAGPVAPTFPTSTILHAVYVPEPPTRSADITIVVPATVAVPSTKLARFAVLIALTRWPDENALPAVIVNVLFPDPKC